jgi:cytochrome b pre-mRNA-processing protein 3
MFFKKLFGRNEPQRDAAQRLYLKTVAKARDPQLYTALGVADTVDGRFDMIVIHVMLVIRRLRAAGESAAAVGQAMFDYMFGDMDRSLREMGVGDLSVGKHVKGMAKAFYGRAEAYEEGMDEMATMGDGKLTEALRDLVYGGTGDAAKIKGLGDYLMRADRHLAGQEAERIVSGEIDFNVAVTP